MANVGVAYNGQWKVTRDEGITLPPALDHPHRYLAVGPEIDYPILKTPRPLFLTLRYFFELEHRVAPQGRSIYVGLTLMQPTKAPANAADR